MHFASLTILLIMFLFITICTKAQQSKINSIKRELANAKTDPLKIDLLEQLGQSYRDAKKMDSSILAFQRALEVNEKSSYSLQRQCWNTAAIDYILYEMGNYAESLKYAERHLALSEKLNDTLQKGMSHLVFGHNYREFGEYRQSLNHYFKAKKSFKIYQLHRNHPEDNTYTILCIAQVYLKMNQLDSALIYTRQGYKLAKDDPAGGVLVLLSTRIFGDIYVAKSDDKTALYYYRQYIPNFVKYKETNRDLGFVLNSMAKIFQKTNQNDSAIFYAKKALDNALAYRDQENIYDAATSLYNFYKSKSDFKKEQPAHEISDKTNATKYNARHILITSNLLYNLNDSMRNESEAFKYFKIATAAKDSMAGIEKIKQMQILAFNEQVRQQEQVKADAKAAARTRLLISIAAIIVLITSFLVWTRIRQLRLKYKIILEQKETEKLKTKYEKDLLKLEAKALRAQMNPHFIFNSMNSIKSLINKNENEKATNYLTTFSKLIRTLFNNSDKREVSLFEEIETCKLYTQLETMRFGDNIKFIFHVDRTIDLKDIKVPALILQPLIENAIWHGLVPKETGGTIIFSVKETNGTVACMIDDDGIGRELSNQYKAQYRATHESKGIGMTQSRLELDKLLNEREDSIQIVDKINDVGKAEGTKVIITFKEIGN